MSSEISTDARRARPIEQQWPNLNLLGMGVWCAWIWLCYGSAQLFAFADAPTQGALVRLMYLASTLGIALAMGVYARAWRRATRLARSNAFVLGMGIAASLATAALGLPSVHAADLLAATLAFLTGVCTSALCLRSGYLYGQMGVGYTLTAGGIALALATTLYFAGLSLPGWFGILFIACLPVIAALLMAMHDDDPFALDTDEEAARRVEAIDVKGRAIFRRLVGATALVALVAGIGRGVGATAIDGHAFRIFGMLSAALPGAFAVAIVIWLNERGARKAIKGSYTLLMVLGIAIALVSSASGLIELMGVVKETLWFVFTCLIAYMSFRFEFSTVRSFALAQAAYFLASTLGWALGGVLGRLTTSALVLQVGIAVAFVLVITLVFVLRPADIDYIVGFRRERSIHHEPQEGVPAQGADDDAAAVEVPASRPRTLSQASPALQSPRDREAASGGAAGNREPVSADDILAQRYALSQREIGIARMFAQGRSANWIADDLTISKNTVRSHLRSVYVKLDVHTRQELIDLLEGLERAD